MAVPTQDFTGALAWEQGEDQIVLLNYTDEGVVLNAETHAVRMDIAPILEGGKIGDPVIVLNSDDEEGEVEVTFGSEESDNEISIRIPRSATIGPDAPKMEKKVAMYVYDVFLRNRDNDRQRKILQGKIAMNRSVTHWL